MLKNLCQRHLLNIIDLLTYDPLCLWILPWHPDLWSRTYGLQPTVKVSIARLVYQEAEWIHRHIFVSASWCAKEAFIVGAKGWQLAALKACSWTPGIKGLYQCVCGKGKSIYRVPLHQSWSASHQCPNTSVLPLSLANSSLIRLQL